MSHELAALTFTLDLSGLLRAVSAITTASFGLVALLYVLLVGTRREMSVYAALALLLALDIALPLPFFPPLTALRLFLDVTLPALGYVFLLLFLELPISIHRRALVAVCACGAVAAAASPVPWEGIAAAGAAVALFVLSGDVLVALSRKPLRRKPTTALLFTGTAMLVVAALVDVASDRGIFLSALPVPLRGPAFVLFTALLLAAMADEGRRIFAKATTDALTGLANRAAFLERATAEMVRAERTGRSCALAMLDIDHFKSFNDRYGHQTGDRVLVATAQAIAETVRGIDVAGRYGGEEFIVLFVESDEEAARAAVERIRAAISALAPPRVPETITASAGVAVHHGLFERTRVPDLIRRADAALYESKRAGRNRTTVEDARRERPKSAADVWYR